MFDIEPELASLKAVPILLRLKDLLGFEPKKDVIKLGGYRSQEQFIEHMLMKLEQAFAAQRSVRLTTSTRPGVASHDVA